MATTDRPDAPSLQDVLDRLEALSQSLSTGGARPPEPVIETAAVDPPMDAPVESTPRITAEVEPTIAAEPLAEWSIRRTPDEVDITPEDRPAPPQRTRSAHPLAGVIAWAIALSVVVFAAALGIAFG